MSKSFRYDPEELDGRDFRQAKKQVKFNKRQSDRREFNDSDDSDDQDSQEGRRRHRN